MSITYFYNFSFLNFDFCINDLSFINTNKKSFYMKGRFIMNNNKNRMRDREKSNAELRKIDPKNNADIGIIDGQIIGVHESKHEKSRKSLKN